MFKKLIASALSATFLCSSVMLDRVIEPQIVHDVPLAENAKVSTNQNETKKHKSGHYDLEASNSLGKYITNVAPLNNDNVGVQAKTLDTQLEFSVTNLGFDDKTGTIAVASSQTVDCKVSVKFINEDTGELAQEVTADVKAGESVLTEAKADISKLPEYYSVSAQLVDKMGNPVGNVFKIDTYTRMIQEIKATDIHDFNAEQVVNFDESEKTNFLVLNENTVKAESSENENTLVSADYDNNTFIFDNIDDTVKNLKEGEYFYIQPSKDDIIAVSVDNISIDGDQATISGNNNIDDMFDFVKFEATSDNTEAKVNTESKDDTINYTEHEGEKEFTFDTAKPLNFAYNSNRMLKYDKHLEASKDINFKEKEWKKGKAEAKFSAGITFGTEIDFYKKWGYTSFSFTISLEFSIKLEAEVKCSEDDWDLSKFDKLDIAGSLGDFEFPTSIPGVNVSVEPSLVGNLTGEFEISETIGGKVGFKYNTDDGFEWIHEFLLDNEDTSLKLAGELFIGLKLEPGVTVVSKKIAFAGLNFTFGIVVSAETTISRREIVMKAKAKYSSSKKTAIMDTDEDTVHNCKFCIDGSVGLKFTVGAELKLLNKKIGDWETEFSKSLNFLDFTFSIPYLFSLKTKDDECPHQKYRVKFDVNMLGTEVTLDGLTQATNSEGIAAFYCDNGSYSYSVKRNGEVVKTGSITVNNSTHTEYINIKLKEDKDGNIKVDGVDRSSEKGTKHEKKPLAPKEELKLHPSDFSSSDGVDRSLTQAIQLGDNITGLAYPDGYVYIYGHGDMYDFSSSPFDHPENIKSVIFENTDPEKGLVITGIGNCLFYGAKNLDVIYWSNDIKRIGNYAFYNCNNLKYLRYNGEKDVTKTFVLPTALTNIGNYAFYGCNSAVFGAPKLPAGITNIGNNAFAGCKKLTGVTLQTKVKTVGDRAFSGCTGLKKAVISKSVTSIGSRSFENCTSLQSLTLPYAGLSADYVAKNSYPLVY
ncbi:MAG: leucine-rich repeat domain-containing protein, partial [Ruminococcus sp.]|nr:leucine-rich repeat domain-containing protein [Ruminococcus sp.]